MTGAVSPLVALRQRPGRRYEPIAEAALEPHALAAAHALPHAHRGLMVVREASGPFGVPDFIAVVGDAAALAERQALDVPPLLNEVDAGIVASLSTRRGRGVEKIAATLGWPIGSVERRLSGLSRSGAIEQIGANRFVRQTALQPIGRLYAIETKVKDWRRAVKQGRTYRLWCDNYVVVIGALSDSAAMTAVDVVGSDAGGLLADGRWVVRPKPWPLSERRRLWGSEHVVAALQPSPALGGAEEA